MAKSFRTEKATKTIRVINLRQQAVAKLPRFELGLLSTPNLKREYKRVLKEGRTDKYDYFTIQPLQARLNIIEHTLQKRGVNIKPMLKERSKVKSKSYSSGIGNG